MNCEIMRMEMADNEKEVDGNNYEKNNFHPRNVIEQISNHDEKLISSSENYSESCVETFRKENNPSYDLEEDLRSQHLEDETKPIEQRENISTHESTDRGLYESENDKKTEDDEETVLLNGIAKTLITRIIGSSDQGDDDVTRFKNERLRTTGENLSNNNNKKVKNNQEVKSKGRKLKKNGILATIDVLFSVVVVSPLVVSYWRGIWTLMDAHDEMFPAYGCYFLGMGIHTAFAILKYYFHGKFAKELKIQSLFARFGYRIVKMSYTYIFSAACIMHWRGAWIIFDDCIASYEWFWGRATIFSVVALILLLSVRNLIAPPYVVAIDKRGYIFRFPTRFNVSSRDWPLYILDCAFSVGVVGTLVVFVWRGVWVIFDLYLFPDNPKYSAVGSIVIGYTIVVITFSLQPLMRYACTRLKGLPRLAAVDIFLLLSFAGTVNVWRGVWNVLGLWLLPEDPELSCWITHLGCFIFLVLLNCSNSILVRGVYIDAEEEEGKCAVFPCHYLRLFFKIEREKKEARRQNLIVASRDLTTITERTEKEENEALMNISNSTNVVQNPESLV